MQRPNVKRFLPLLLLLLIPTVAAAQVSFNVVNVPFNATVMNFYTGNGATEFDVTLTGNANITQLNGGSTGVMVVFKICQDNSGSRTWVWPTNVNNPPSISGTANVCTLVSFINNGQGTWDFFASNASAGSGTITGNLTATHIPIATSSSGLGDSAMTGLNGNFVIPAPGAGSALDVSGAIVFHNTLSTGALTSSSATVSNLTSGRCVQAGSSGLLGFTASGCPTFSGSPVSGNVVVWGTSPNLIDTGVAITSLPLIHGTPTAANFAAWFDATHVEDSGVAITSVPTISGTPTTGDVVVWATPGTLGDGGLAVTSSNNSATGTGSAGPTTIANPGTNFVGRVSFYLYTSVAGTGGTATVTITYKDRLAGTQTIVSSTIDLTVAGSFINPTYFLAANDGITNAAITYTVTVTGATGTPHWALVYGFERVP